MKLTLARQSDSVHHPHVDRLDQLDEADFDPDERRTYAENHTCLNTS